jgi:hypothetical protein
MFQISAADGGTRSGRGRIKHGVRDQAEVSARGYGRLYAQEILGADEGCDFRFLKPGA